MNIRKWKSFLLMTCLLLAVVSITGCKASKKKVEESTYYKELMSKYKELKKENKKLREKTDDQQEVSEAEKRAEKFLAKIARDNLVRVEVGYPDEMEDCYYIEEKEVYGAAIYIAERADRTTKYTPEELKKQYTAQYKYVLYDENNAIYELETYGENYVIFSDLPNYVYYVPKVCALGDAFLKNKIIHPPSNTLHRLSEAPLMSDSDGQFYEENVSVSIANCIDQMTKEKTSREKAENAWKKEKKTDSDSPEDYEPKSVTYTFYTHGKIMSITLYDRYFSILNVDENRTWYKVTKTDIKNIKTILTNDQKARGIDTKDQNKKTDEEVNSHTKEIEEESVISSDDE